MVKMTRMTQTGHRGRSLRRPVMRPINCSSGFDRRILLSTSWWYFQPCPERCFPRPHKPKRDAERASRHRIVLKLCRQLVDKRIDEFVLVGGDAVERDGTAGLHQRRAAGRVMAQT